MPGPPANICFVATHAYPVLVGDATAEFAGGAELQQVIVGRELARRGHRVTMICMDHGQPDGTVIDGIHVLKAYQPDTGIPVIRFVWPRLTSIWRCMERAKAAIYYTRTATRLTGVVAAYCRTRGRKSIFAGGGNPDFDRRTERIKHVHDRLIHEYGLRHVDRILVQNEDQRQRCARNFGRHSTLIPNCYPDPGAQRAKPDGYALWVSTLRTVKRPELVLDLARMLPHRHFKVIGGPDRNDRSLYEKIESDAASIPNIEFLGYVAYADIDKHFDDAGVVINTSESEGFPNTFLQAWSRGVPTVSFFDCEARLKDSDVGLHVTSIEEMRETVEQLACNPEQWQVRSRLSRRYYEEHHTPEQIIRLYEALFAEL